MSKMNNTDHINVLTAAMELLFAEGGIELRDTDRFVLDLRSLKTSRVRLTGPYDELSAARACSPNHPASLNAFVSRTVGASQAPFIVYNPREWVSTTMLNALLADLRGALAKLEGQGASQERRLQVKNEQMRDLALALLMHPDGPHGGLPPVKPAGR